MHTLTLIQQALAVVSGLLVGFTLGLIGGGGSILAVPLLLYVVGYDNPHMVIGTTALAVALTAYINLIPHWRAGNGEGDGYPPSPSPFPACWARLWERRSARSCRASSCSSCSRC